MPKTGRKELQTRIDNVVNLLNHWVYYDSDVPLEIKEQLIRVIYILKGNHNDTDSKEG